MGLFWCASFIVQIFALSVIDRVHLCAQFGTFVKSAKFEHFYHKGICRQSMPDNKNIKRIIITTLIIAALLIVSDLFFPVAHEPASDSAVVGAGDHVSDVSDDESASVDLEPPTEASERDGAALAADLSNDNMAARVSDSTSSGMKTQPPKSKNPPQQSESRAQVLSPRVLEIIEEVQKRQLDGQWEEALNEMNALYTEMYTLNSFEQMTLLNFYTNVLLRLEMWQEAISAFSLLRTIEDVRPDVEVRSLMALGQLSQRVDDKEAAVGYYELWLAATQGQAGLEQQTATVKRFIDELSAQ